MNFKNLDKINKQYISEFDKFLQNLDKNYPKSPSQQEEIRKHLRIFHLRDEPAAANDESIWGDF